MFFVASSLRRNPFIRISLCIIKVDPLLKKLGLLLINTDNLNFKALKSSLGDLGADRAMKKIAVIVAGGNGTRMNSSLPKQFMLLNGKPVLYYTINSFLTAYKDLSIILVLPEEYIAAGQEIIDAFFDYNRIKITAGGRTRFHSVQIGLQLITEESIIFVHDGVRCLLTTQLIHRCYEAALEHGSAIPATDCKDSVRLLRGEENEAIERSMIKLVQTPQTFHSKILLPAFKIDFKEKFTDEATVVEAFGLKVHLTEGEENNIKITRPADLVFAEQLLIAASGNTQ